MPHPARATPTGYLILDWNGTIVDDVHRARTATEAAATAVNQHVTFESVVDFQLRFTLPLVQFFTDLGVTERDLPEAIDVWNCEMAARTTTLAPGARPLLTRAQEIGMAVHVVSGATEQAVRTDAERLGIESLIDTVAGEVHPKRDEIRSLRRTHAPLVYVGDTEYDIAEAHAADAITVATTYGYARVRLLREAGAHLVVDDLADLIPVLEAITSQSPSQAGLRSAT